MNIAQAHNEQKLKELLDKLTLHNDNRAMAMEYLQTPEVRDDLLAQARPSNFLHKNVEQRLTIGKYLETYRNRKDMDMMARFYKLFWAIGKGTATFMLGQDYFYYSRKEKRDWCIDVLGEAAVAAMEATDLTWNRAKDSDWLHHLARTNPAVLEEAQTLAGTEAENVPFLLAGILLCHVTDEAIIRRQREILLHGHLSCVTEAIQGLQDPDRQLLAEYIRQGDPKRPLPVVNFVTQPIMHYGFVVPANGFLIAQAGAAAFLAGDLCALRIFASLHSEAIMHRIFDIVPHEIILDRLDLLAEALPRGLADLLLHLAQYTAYSELAEKLRSKCLPALKDALKLADEHQYAALCRLYPGTAQKVDGSLEDRIVKALSSVCAFGHSAIQDYLWAKGDLGGTAEALKDAEGNTYTLGRIHSLVTEYKKQYGWNNFACRCAVVVGLVFHAGDLNYIISGNWNVAEKDLREMVEALLEQGLPAKEVMEILGECIGYFGFDGDAVMIRTAADNLLCKPENLEDLRGAALHGNVHARSMSIAALKTLSDREGLLACAGDSSKQIKEQLQDVFVDHPAWSEDYVELLKHKKAAQRLLAAQVLGKLGLKEPLEAALATEKNAKVAQAIMDAVGQSAAPLDANETLAERVLRGNKARKVQWLLDHPLPALHQNDGTELPEDVRTAILVAFMDLGRIGRCGTAEELAKDVKPADLEALAHEVYELWLAAGAQAKQKWVLAFAAIYGGSAMVRKLLKAINDWPQHARGAIACEAVNALILNPDPAALLAVDAISRKFKFRQIKTAAAAALENAAQELGISAEELADRIVPDLGFGADGKQVFDYGNRSFTVRLTPTLELEITNHLGKKVKNLPAPGKTDDAEQANAAYEAFKAMKKQMKATVSAQKTRLETALSALRCWDGEAWEKLFVGNPVMHQFAIGLVWGVYRDGQLEDTFRYMEDGTFNTVDEEEFELPENASIGLVHPVELDEDLLDQWKQQLEDYEITQPIIQLERPVYRVTEDEMGATSLERFGGKVLHSLSLAGKLTGAGWSRGSVRDGGMYTEFYREDAALGMAVELKFSGSFVGYEEESVTVFDAVFYKPGTVEHGSYVYDNPKEENIFSLSRIPARYFSEVVYQLERATAASTETDADWKEKRD